MSAAENIIRLFLTFLWGFVGLIVAIFRLFRLGPKRFFTKIDRPVPPSQATDPIYGAHEMIKLKSSGITLHYVSKGLPSQPLMLFVHGYPECWYSWRFQIKHFARKYRVVAIDQRGYGLSTKPPYIADYKIATLARDVADIIEQLGYESCILVGHDWGGITAWATAMLYSHLVEKLIIMNCPHPFAFRKEISLAQMRRSWYMFFYQWPFVPEMFIQSDDFSLLEEAFFHEPMGMVNTRNMTKEDLEVFKYTLSQKGTTKAALNYYRAMFKFPPDFPRAQITAPTLLLWGVKDGALGENLADASKKYCANIRLFKIPNASHWVQQDVPDDCNNYMEAFLNENPVTTDIRDF